MHVTEQLTDLLARNPNALGFSILALVAFIEYVFPPFPGDVVTLFGAFLVTKHGWPPALVLGATLVGSAAGCMIVYGVGRRLDHSAWLMAKLGRARPRIDAVVEKFRQHGTLYIIINRFLPSLRAFFFLAAGMAKIHPLKVLFFGLVSAALWNTLLIVAGMTLANSWEEIVALFHTYQKVAWALIALVAAIWTLRWALRRGTAKKAD